MGNSGSQPTGHSTQRSSPIPDENQWIQSFPRSPYQHQQHKLIVPDRDAHQRLRPTGNGEILHAGGTISGRSQQWQGVNRSSSIPAVRQRRPSSPQHNIGEYSQQQHHRQQQRQHQKYRHNQPRVLTPSYRKDQIKRFGSEPDLRSPSKSMNEYHDRYKGRKKYKAPQPPLTPLSSIEKHHSDFDDNCGIEISSPIRRVRLFKTRAETKKKISSPVHNRRSIATVQEFSPLEMQHKFKSTDALFTSHIDCMTSRKPHESNLSNNGSTNSNNSNNGKVQSIRLSIPQMQRTRSSPEFQAELKQVTRRLVNLRREAELTNNDSKLKTLDHNINKKDVIRNKLKASRDMMIMEERTPASGKESTPEMSPPKVKTFYFGMEHDEPSQKIPNSIGSDITSESETEASGHDISLQLRPILPKKQLEIPRFSPAAAWKLLSSVDTNFVDSTLASEEGSLFLEDRIEKLARPPPPYRLQMGQRSNHDKSGDSGISGDETPDAVIPSPKQRGISWTPQQDLGDDSSLEDGSNLDFSSNTVKFPTRPHVFSLSLPRENRLATYINEKNFLQPYSSLQKLKRSMSGVLGTLAKKDNEIEQDTAENWFLSRSAPNSLNNGFSSLEMRRQNKQDEFDGPKQTRRIMYLPQSSNLQNSAKKKHLSKSYEHISPAGSKCTPQDLQDPPKDENMNINKKWTKKPKKFTFQSTVRQIERKRLADKLSKEAERKEQQRLRELEAMQRVEEEFQKKRAREKATIRQQLRLYSMDETAWSSLPPNLDINEELRAEPDGAVSSSTSSPTFKKNNADRESKAPVTQILSEFRQSHREYKEFRSGTRYLSDQHQHATTVHPRVTCNMPKATDNSYTSGNYRKHFAHGIRSGEYESSYANSDEKMPAPGIDYPISLYFG